MPFVKCTFFSTILVSLGKDIFFHILWWMHLICMWKGPIFLQNNNSLKQILIKIFASFILSTTQNKKKKHLLSAYNVCLIVLDTTQSYQENYSHTSWCCVTARNDTGGRGNVTSACVIFVCHFGSSFGSSWTSLPVRWEHVSLRGVKLHISIMSSAYDSKQLNCPWWYNGLYTPEEIKRISKKTKQKKHVISLLFFFSQPHCLEKTKIEVRRMFLSSSRIKTFPREASWWAGVEWCSSDVQRGHRCSDWNPSSNVCDGNLNSLTKNEAFHQINGLIGQMHWPCLGDSVHILIKRRKKEKPCPTF